MISFIKHYNVFQCGKYFAFVFRFSYNVENGIDLRYLALKTYLLDLLCPTSKNMAFKWNGVVVLGYPVIESLLHLWVVRVNVC